MAQRTYVYVDGLNLYFGALRRTPYRWLNLRHLCELLLPGNQIDRIKYFTAHVSARPQNPTQPLHQQIYLRALRTLPNLEIVLGHFLTHEVMMPVARTPPDKPLQYVRVMRSEEKGSDVNIATHLVHDAHLNRFDIAVVISNDSDLLEAVKIVKGLGKIVGIVNPHENPSRVLSREASFMRQVRAGPLSVSLFQDQLSDKHGSFFKPAGW